MLSGRTSGDRTTWLHAEALRWSLLAFAIAGSIAGVGHWTKTDDIRPAQPPAWADATILVGSLLALAATWWWLDRPYSTLRCTLARAPIAKPSKKSWINSDCRSPTSRARSRRTRWCAATCRGGAR